MSVVIVDHAILCMLCLYYYTGILLNVYYLPLIGEEQVNID